MTHRFLCSLFIRALVFAAVGIWSGPIGSFAQEPEKPAEAPDEQRQVPDLGQLVAEPQNALKEIAAWYELDRSNLMRFYSVPQSPVRRERLTRFGAAWLAALAKLDAAALGENAGEEHAKLKQTIGRDLARLDRESKEQEEIATLVPFTPAIVALEESRRRIEPIDGRQAAAALDSLSRQLIGLTQRAERELKSDAGGDGNGQPALSPELAKRAGVSVLSLRQALRAWHVFYDGYDPLVTWWTAEPYKAADAALEKYAAALGVKPSEEARGGSQRPGAFSRGAGERPRDGDSPEDAQITPLVAVEPPADLSDVPDLTALIAPSRSEMGPVIERYQRDRFGFRRTATVGGSRGFGRGGPGPAAGQRDASSNDGGPLPDEAERAARQEKVALAWLKALEEIDFEALSQGGRIDWLLLRNNLQRDVARSKIQAQEREILERWLPMGSQIADLDRARRRNEPPSAEQTRALLEQVTHAASEAAATAAQRAGAQEDDAATPAIDLPTVLRILPQLERQERSLSAAVERFSNADDAWRDAVRQPAEAATAALNNYASLLQEKFIAPRRWQTGGIEGQPIGRAALLVELAGEMIPYAPEELLVIAEREYAWCQAELKRATRELGLGDDCTAAIEKVKQMHVEPGRQPQLIRDLAKEAIDYVTQHDLVSVPPIARETWRMQMMSPERQLVNPFFTGGETISVSYPTSTMAHDAKLQSMRGNNIPFARATVHHELIPGHHLQGYMTARYQPHRGMFSTAFWGEGWALYWEMLLWDHGFVTTPEDRVGMLVWRMHRCARIVFSLSFHLGRMSPQECIDYLVARVGFDRENATAEVRRSFGDRYGALYQAAYMLGGLQFRALHRELVESGQMTDRQFHDAVLQQNRMPVEMVRAALTNQSLTPEFVSSWRFYGPIAAAPDASAAQP